MFLGESEAYLAEGLGDEHEADHELVGDVDAALGQAVKAKSKEKQAALERLAATFAAWRDPHMAHLKHEEAVLMPLTRRAGDSPVRCCWLLFLFWKEKHGGTG